MSAAPGRTQREFAREELEKGQQLFPGQTSAPSLGLVPVEAWILAGVLYLAPAALVARTGNGKALLGFARPLRREARP
jgi:hypothetical protein